MSIDTVNDIAPRRQYVATAAQEDFDYPFPIFEDADLVVDVDGTTAALDTDYTVTGAGEDTGGTVSFATPMTGGEVVTIYRDIAITRDTDFQQNGPFRAAAINDEFDKAFLIMQELEAKIGRALRLPLTAEATDAQMELSPLTNWLSKYVFISANGVPEPAELVSGTISQSIIGALLYPRTSGEVSAGVTPTNYNYPPCNVKRYGAVGDNSANDTTAINNAILAATAMRTIVFFPVGEYRTTGIVLSSGSYLPPFVGEDGGGPNTRRVSALIYAGASLGKLITVTGLGSAVRPVFSKLTIHGGNAAAVGIYVTNQRGGLIEDCHFEGYDVNSEAACIELRNESAIADNVEQWTIINNNFINYRTGIRLSNDAAALFPSHAYGYYAGNIFASQIVTSKDVDIGGPNVLGAGGDDLGAGLIRCYWQARTHVSGTGGCHVMVRHSSSIYSTAMFATGESDNAGSLPSYYRFLAQSGHGVISFTGAMDIVEAGLPQGTVMSDSINDATLFFPTELVGSGWTGSVDRPNIISGALSLPVQPSFSAYLGSTAANAAGNGVTYTLVSLTERYDQGGNFNPTTGVFTAPVTGRYLFSVTMQLGDLAVGHTDARLSLVTSNETYRLWLGSPFPMSASGSLSVAATAIVELEAGDTASVTLLVSGGTQVVDVVGGTGPVVTLFAGHLLA